MTNLIYLEDDKAYASEDLMQVECFKNLYKSDKQPHKASWHKWLKYMYFVYKKEGIYWHKLLTDRQRQVCVSILGLPEDSYIDMEEYCKECIKEYIDLQYTTTEHMLIELCADIDKYVRHVKDIPFTSPKEKLDALKIAKDMIVLKQEYEKIVANEKKSLTNKDKPLFEDIG